MLSKLQTDAYRYAEVHRFSWGFDTMYLMYEDKSLGEGINQAEKLVEKECRWHHVSSGLFRLHRESVHKVSVGFTGLKPKKDNHSVFICFALPYC